MSDPGEAWQMCCERPDAYWGSRDVITPLGWRTAAAVTNLTHNGQLQDQINATRDRVEEVDAAYGLFIIVSARGPEVLLQGNQMPLTWLAILRLDVLLLFCNELDVMFGHKIDRWFKKKKMKQWSKLFFFYWDRRYLAVENIFLTDNSPPDSRKRERSIESLGRRRKTGNTFWAKSQFLTSPRCILDVYSAAKKYLEATNSASCPT